MHGHPAIYRGRTYFKSAIEIIKQHKFEKKQDLISRIKKINRYVDPNRPYAATLNPDSRDPVFRQTAQNLSASQFPSLLSHHQQTAPQQEDTSAPLLWARQLLEQFAMINQRLSSVENKINLNDSRINCLLEVNNLDIQEQ